MNQQQVALIFSVLGVTLFILAGIAVAERSLLGFILSILAAVMTIGLGFMIKKKLEKRS